MSVAPSQVLSLRLSLVGFTASWSHCGVVADYVARYAASDRFDPEGLATRVSSFLNELLELLHAHNVGGSLAIDVSREESALHIRCGLPVDAEVAAALSEALSGLDDPDLRGRYRASFDQIIDERPAAAPFMEMAGIHGLAPILERRGDGVVVSLSIPAE